MKIVLETHRTTLGNERGVAAGPAAGTPVGHGTAPERAPRVGRSRLPVLTDWRLRECDDARPSGTPAQDIRAARAARLDTPYAGGERRRQAVARVRPFIRYVANRWPDSRGLVIGHVATRWALEHRLPGTPLKRLAAGGDGAWQPGRLYETTEGDLR